MRATINKIKIPDQIFKNWVPDFFLQPDAIYCRRLFWFIESKEKWEKPSIVKRNMKVYSLAERLYSLSNNEINDLTKILITGLSKNLSTYERMKATVPNRSEYVIGFSAPHHECKTATETLRQQTHTAKR